MTSPPASIAMPRDEVVDCDNFSMQGWVGASIVYAGRHDLAISRAHDDCAEWKQGIGARRRDRQLHRLFMNA